MFQQETAGLTGIQVLVCAPILCALPVCCWHASPDADTEIIARVHLS
jgi:hypothetical protein